MVQVIVAGVLGVITICGGLFLRRLLGELAVLRGQVSEMRRQITRFDRQMRAQRARENFLRQLLIEDEEDGHGEGDGPPQQAAVANGHEPELPPTIPALPDGPEPVRRRGHLWLYPGGAVTASLATITTAARVAIRQQRSHIAAAVTGTMVTAATVTLVTVQPWTADADQQGPSSTATAASSPAYTPQSAPNRAAPPESSPEPSTSESPAAPTAVPDTPMLMAKPTHQRAAKAQNLGGKRTAPPGHTKRHATQPRGRAKHQAPDPPGTTRKQGRPSTPPGRSHLSLGVTAFPLILRVCVGCR